jgi:hypothetical protein
MVDGDFVGVRHGLQQQGHSSTKNLGENDMPTYEFVVDFETSDDDANPFRTNQIHPFLLVGWVYVYGEVANEVYPCGFGVSEVHDVIDVSWIALSQSSATSAAIFDYIERKFTYPGQWSVYLSVNNRRIGHYSPCYPVASVERPPSA